MNNSNIHFLFQNTPISLPSRRVLKDFIYSVFRKERKKFVALNFIFCSDKYLLEINQKFLSQNYYTDIITFDLSENDEIKGEIYISSDRIKENAKKLKTPINKELLRVVFHGILHLCGYRDKTKRDKAIMTAKEDYYLNKWGDYFT